MPPGMPRRRRGPGWFERESVNLAVLTKMLPTERLARLGLSKLVWPIRPYCGSTGKAVPKPNGFRTNRRSDRSRNRWFSKKTGTVMKASHLSCNQWATGMYLFCGNLVGHSSRHLRRDLGMTHKCAWFLGHRLREACQNRAEALFAVSEDIALEEIDVEVDGAYLSGSQTNQRTDRECAGAAEYKIVVVFVGARNRATGHITAKVFSNRGKARAGHRRGRHPSREHRHDGLVCGLQEPRAAPGIGQPLGRPVCLR